MEILWLAIFLYSIGLAVVLQWKPRLMFHENGNWKEFGYQRGSGLVGSRYTLFPVWLFAIAWAFVSYAVAAAAVWILSQPAAAAAATAALSSNFVDSESEVEPDYEEEEEIAIPVSRLRTTRRPTPSAAKPRPGYYVLDPASREAGLRRYVYYGQEPPNPEDEY
jgi:hypothetical protein